LLPSQRARHKSRHYHPYTFALTPDLEGNQLTPACTHHHISRDTTIYIFLRRDKTRSLVRTTFTALHIQHTLPPSSLPHCRWVRLRSNQSAEIGLNIRHRPNIDIRILACAPLNDVSPSLQSNRLRRRADSRQVLRKDSRRILHASREEAAKRRPRQERQRATPQRRAIQQAQLTTRSQPAKRLLGPQCIRR
jgi:hypothetical protein